MPCVNCHHPFHEHPKYDCGSYWPEPNNDVQSVIDKLLIWVAKSNGFNEEMLTQKLWTVRNEWD